MKFSRVIWARLHSSARVWIAVIVIFTLQEPSSLAAQSAPPTYRAGLKSIAIPAPSDLVEPGSDYRVLLEPLAPINNRLVAAFVQKSDLDAIRSGSAPALTRYALVEIPRRAEFANVSPELFKQITDGMAQQFGAEVNSTLKQQQDEVNRRIQALSSGASSVTLEKPVQLGTLFCKPNSCAFGLIMPVTTKGTTTRMLMAVVVMRVQERVLFGYLYTEFKDQDSVKWVSATEEQWADAMLKANAQ
ncbi:MAG: hypothetical protein ACLGSD_14700 [Acidobacteriota bacterium]